MENRVLEGRRHTYDTNGKEGVPPSTRPSSDAILMGEGRRRTEVEGAGETHESAWEVSPSWTPPPAPGSHKSRAEHSLTGPAEFC